MDSELSTIMSVVPLINKNRMIANYPNFIIKSRHGLFTTKKPHEQIQQSVDIQKFEDNCIQPLIMGKQSHCEATYELHTSANLITENRILINNAKNETLHSDCGPDDRILLGNFLITFGNCTVKIHNKTFKSLEYTTKTQITQGALHNIAVNLKMIERHDIALIKQDTIENRNKLQHVYLRQFEHQSWLWSLMGTVSFIFMGTIIFMCIICICNQTTTVKIDNPPQPAIRTFNEHPKLAELFSKTSLDGVAQASPPGEVI